MTLRHIAYKNIKRNSREYIFFLVSLCFCVFTIFTFTSLSNQAIIIKKISDDIKYEKLFQGITVVIYVFVLIYLLLSNHSFMRMRKKEMGLYQLFGLSSFKVSLMMSVELLFLGSIALLFGIIIGMVFYRLNLMILFYMMKSAFPSAILDYQFSVAIFRTIIGFVIIYVLLCLNILFFNSTSSLIDLLKSKKRKEKPYKNGYKMGLIGLILVFISYSLTIITENPSVLFFIMLPVTIIVIVGTCLICIGGVAPFFIWKKQRKNKAEKYQQLIGASLTMHRIRSQSLTIGIISILVAISVTTISFGYTLYSSSEKTARKEQVFDVELILQDNVYSEAQDILMINKIAKQTGVDITSIYSLESYSLAIDSQAEDMGISTSVISESKYNELINQVIYDVEMESIDLHDQEVVGASNFRQDANEQIEIDGQIYDLKKTNQWLPDAFSSNSIVVEDALFSSWIKKEKIKVSGKSYFINVENPLITLSFMDGLNDEFRNRKHGYSISSYGGLYMNYIRPIGLLSFIGFFICGIFIFMSATTLYFKQIEMACDEKLQFECLDKLGMTDHQLKNTIAYILKPIFVLPLCLGLLHSYVAMYASYNGFLKYMIGFTDNFATVIQSTLLMSVIYIVCYSLVYIMTKVKYYQVLKS